MVVQLISTTNPQLFLGARELSLLCIAVAVGKDSGALQLLGVTVVCVALLGCVAAGDSLCLRFAGDGELSVVQSIKLCWGIVVVQLLDVVLSGALCADEDNF